MESYQSLRILHGLAAVLPLLCSLLLAYYGWRAWRSGEAGRLAKALQRIALGGWLLVAGSLISLPVTGWLMVHSAGWPLGQRWLLGSACLLLPTGLFWLLFSARLRRLRQLALSAQQAEQPLAVEARRELRYALIFLLLTLLCVVAMLLLMVLKPA